MNIFNSRVLNSPIGFIYRIEIDELEDEFAVFLDEDEKPESNDLIFFKLGVDVNNLGFAEIVSNMDFTEENI